MKKRTKAIIAGIVLLFVVAGGVVTYLSLFHQSAPVVNDHTRVNRENPDQQDGGNSNTEEENVAVFSSGVNIFEESEAEQINEAINSYEITNQGLILNVDSGSPLEMLGTGDIFYLEGDPTTPLGETYIGKIISETESNGVTTYVIDDPSIDEVFDVLDIDYGQYLTNDNISQIRTVEGVTVQGDGIPAYTATGASSDDGYRVTILEGALPDQTASNLYTSSKGDLLFDVKLDLLKAFGLKESAKDNNGFQKTVENKDGDTEIVYTTKTGICYHKENCVCVSRSKFRTTLRAAVYEGWEACYMCNPPLLKDADGVISYEPSLEITGQIGVKDMYCDVDFDWDILSGQGINTAAIDVSGDVVAEVELKSSLKFEFGGRATTIKLPMDCVKIQGLSEKMFPVAFVGYNFTTVVNAAGKEQLHAVTSTFPLTVGVVVYLDSKGQASLSGTVSLDYKKEFRYSHVLVQDGQWVNRSESTPSEGELTVEAEVELAGDVDVHIGTSVMLYVFNLNPMELAIAKVGFEGEGSLKMACSSDMEPTDDMISKSYYMRMYLKLLELRFKLKSKVSLGPWSFDLPSADITAIALDHTIFELGSKNQTRYKPGEMSYSIVTAQDGEYYYYKDTNGHLLKEKDSVKSALYTDEFFAICGIDESYIYLLRNNKETSGTHDIYRVSKEDGTGKMIASEVTNCLTMDEEYLYYVSGFDSSTIQRLNRQTLKEDGFYTAAGEIRYMSRQDDGFYVVYAENDSFSWLFGSDMQYLLLNRDGAVVTTYGPDPGVASMQLAQLPGYYMASKIVSSGYLRNTAEEVYWLSNDRTAHVKAECVSGWNSDDAGIFTTVNNGSSGFKIVLYRAEDGQRVDVTDVQSDQAFFTLCQSSSGNWFFFDQTQDSLILYTMDQNYENKTVVKEFSLSEIPCSLTECGMTIMGDRIYFYTIQDNTTSRVLYRYDII